MPHLPLGGFVGALLIPHARGASSAKSKQDAQSDTEAPDSLHLETGGLGSAGPHPVVDAGHVGADGVQEGDGGRGGVGGGQGGAVEVREGLADNDGDHDHGDEHGAVECGGGEEMEHGIKVEDGGYGDVEHGDAGLRGC